MTETPALPLAYFPIRLARWIFSLAAVYGIPLFVTWFFHTPHMVGRASSQQPEIYYGFAGLGLAWQIAFLLIASDPLRYRPLMLIAAIGEKFLFSGLLVLLLIRGIARPHWIPAAVIDFVLGCGFLLSYVLTGKK
jgi:hypothetical protein